MLKSALLCPTRPAREPRGPPGRGSEPPHPDAAPLQLPRRRKQQQKESVAAAPPPRATAQAPELPGLREAKWAKKPDACTDAAQTFTYTPTLTHIHAQQRKTSWLHYRGREAPGKRLGGCRSLGHRRRRLTTPVPATPTAATAGATAGAGATAAASSSTGLEMGGVGRKEERGRGSGETD